MKRVGKLRVQCDLWPIDDLGERTDGATHVLTVIVVGAYTSKPSVKEIAKACEDAAKILQVQ